MAEPRPVWRLRPVERADADVSACKRHPFLDVPRVGGDAEAGEAQKRTRRHLVNLEAVALLQHRAGDEACQRFIHCFLAVESEGGRFDLSGDIEERPSQGPEFFFQIVRIETAFHRCPSVRVQLAPGPEGWREERTLLDQYGSRCDQRNIT